MKTSLLILCLSCFLSCFHTSEAQHLNKEESLFIKKHASVLSRDKNFDKTDWSQVLKDVKGADMVLLGEANHGSKEIFEIRNSLIRSLCQNLDFEVILFEAGIGEMILPNFKKTDKSAAELTEGFFGIWQTRAFEDLMEFVKENDVEIAGFDVQRSGKSFRYLLQQTAGRALLNKRLYQNIEDRFGQVAKELTQRKPYEEVQGATQKLIVDYQKLSSELARKAPNQDKMTYKFTQKVIENRIAYLSYFLDFVKEKDWNKRWAARDAMMAENVKWLRREIYPGKKVIVIGHNYHIAKYNEKEQVMGAMLHEGGELNMKSIAIFPRTGNYAGNYREQKEIAFTNSENLDLKEVMAEIDAYASYLKIPQKPKKGSEWLYEKIKVDDTFINLSGDDKMNLSLHFDSLIFVEEVSLPEFLGSIP